MKMKNIASENNLALVAFLASMALKVKPKALTTFLMLVDFNLAKQLWKFNWFPCLAFGYGLQNIFLAFLNFLEILDA